MAMNGWLKCNRCYRDKNTSSKEFYVTQCEHIYCAKCVERAKSQCTRCNYRGAKAILLEKIPPSMAHYFSPIGPLVERIFEAARFQKHQFDIFFERIVKNQEDYQRKKRRYQEALETKKKFVDLRDRLRMALAKESRDVAIMQRYQNRTTAHCQARARESRNVPDIQTDNNLSQRSRIGRASSISRDVRIPQNLEYTKPRPRPRSSACVGSRLPVSILKQSTRIPAEFPLQHQLHYRHHQHRESENRRPAAIAPERGCYQRESSVHRSGNYNNRQIHHIDESQYRPRTIFSSGYSSGQLDRTPNSMESSSNASSSGGTLLYNSDATSRYYRR